MNTYEKAFTKINLRKSDAASSANIDVAPLMTKWQEAARAIFHKLTLDANTEIASNINEVVTADEMFSMFEENKTVGELVNYAIAKKQSIS